MRLLKSKKAKKENKSVVEEQNKNENTDTVTIISVPNKNKTDDLIVTSIMDAEAMKIFNRDEIDSLSDDFHEKLLETAIKDAISDKTYIKKSKRKMILSSVLLWSIVIILLALCVILICTILIWDRTHQILPS
ncbi:hypothetical protein [Mycoplasmopsis iners]|uniref:hypothetical protein n=1 Tax=Mycoplasmopsis iners TaxID=76630 RepID=UPI0004980F3D|nr:hypothetical protein [Mycoplasmopsis iners]